MMIVRNRTRQTCVFGILALVVIFGLCPPHGRSDIVNDGCYYAQPTFQVQFHSLGQSFVAVDDSLHAIGVLVRDLNPGHAPDDHDLTIELYEGAGFGGTLIDSATVNDIPDSYDGDVRFLFPGGIALTVGAVYTFSIIDDTPRWGLRMSLDSYADGNAWLFGKPDPSLDVRFQVVEDAVTDLPCTVTLNDLRKLIPCMSGPDGNGGVGTCSWIYVDNDNDVDLADFAQLQREFTGDAP